PLAPSSLLPYTTLFRSHGASPHGGNYGKITWDEAMHLAGSRQVALGKKLLEQYPWHRFTPHPEWAAFTGEAAVSLEGCQWLWFPDRKSTRLNSSHGSIS